MTRNAMRSVVLGFAVAAQLFALGAGELSAAERSEADLALARRANQDCTSPRRAVNAKAVINYQKGTYKCVETGSSRR